MHFLVYLQPSLSSYLAHFVVSFSDFACSAHDCLVPFLHALTLYLQAPRLCYFACAWFQLIFSISLHLLSVFPYDLCLLFPAQCNLQVLLHSILCPVLWPTVIFLRSTCSSCRTQFFSLQSLDLVHDAFEFASPLFVGNFYFSLYLVTAV